MSQRLPVLDALRMAAALWVFMAHAVFAENYFVTGSTTPLVNQPYTGFTEVIRTGWFGVDLFFVISGIVITRTAVGRTAPDFLVARLSRIAPSFLVGVTIAVLIAYFLGGTGTTAFNGHAGISELLPSLTLMNWPLANPVSAEASYWTLWVEAKFYMLVAICLLICRIGSRRAIVVFLVLWFFGATVMREAAQPLFDTLLLMPYAPYFILGAALGMVRSRRELVALSPLVLASLTLAASTAQMRGAFATWTSTICVLVVMALIVLGLLVRGSGSWLSRTATTLGLASFPLYLLNLRFGGLVVGALESRGVSMWVSVTIGALVLVGISTLWATKVEPRLQRRLKAVMQAGLGELRGSPAVGRAASTAPAEPSAPAEPVAAWEPDEELPSRPAVPALGEPYGERRERWPVPPPADPERLVPAALAHEPETLTLHRRAPHPGPRAVGSHPRLPSRTPVDARDNL
jgi:peptidoglycan/LPS O-acetylase OafA/YrhL